VTRCNAARRSARRSRRRDDALVDRQRRRAPVTTA
jgi:hypothetical protein